MNKQDWIEYFEALNGRTPSAEETAQALANGEFIDNAFAQATPTQEPVQPQAQSGQFQQQYQQVPPQQPFQQQFQQGQPQQGQAQFGQQMQQGFNQFQQNQQVQNFKVKGKNYLNWFISALKNPIPTAEQSHFGYALITLGLSALLMGGSLINFFRRVFSSIANASVSGESLRASAPEVYDRLISAISNNFGIGSIVHVSIVFFILYAFVAFLPALINRLSGQAMGDWKEDFGRSSQFLPLLMVINLIALLVSFMVKEQLVISDNYLSSFTDIGYYLEDGITQVISILANLTKEVPAIESIVKVFIYISLASFGGLMVLLVAFIRNIKSSYKKLNEFYVSLIGFVVVVFAVDFAYKMAGEALGKAIAAIFERIINL